MATANDKLRQLPLAGGLRQVELAAKLANAYRRRGGAMSDRKTQEQYEHDEETIDERRGSREAQFREDMRKAGYEVHDYSGRGMYGRCCPSVHIGRGGSQRVFRATEVSLQEDSLGLGLVLFTG